MQMKHLGGRRHSGSLSAVATTLAVALLAFMLPNAGASASDSNLSSDQVAAEIVRVQGLADGTAERWAEAQLRSEELAGELTVAETQLAEAEAQYSKLENDLSAIAIDRFTSASSQSMLILFDDPTEGMQVNALRSLALDVGATDLDYIDSVQSDLADARSTIQELNDENTLLTEDLAAREAELDVQLAQLTTLREHLEDEEVKRAYEEQLARQRQEQAEQQARAAAAVTTVPASPPKGGGAQHAATTPSTPQAPQTPTASTPRAPTASTPKPPDEPEPEPEPESPSPPAVVNVGSGWVCPVAGPNAFGDTWGAPRSGGRSHQGVDMMSPGGTPLVSVVAGSVTMKTNALGGNVVWLTGVDGAKYYYAHLSAWEGSSRSVSAGEVIGYVGSTGNTSANHLHFEIHPGGGAAVNPTPTVRQNC